MEAERGKKTAKERESLKLVEVDSWGRRKKKHSYNIKIQDITSTEEESTTSYPEDLANILIESGYTKQQIVNVHETDLYYRYHLRLS